MSFAEDEDFRYLASDMYGHGKRQHVVLTTEGTYPHFKGGVSTWCHILLQQMPEVDFTLWALMMNPFVASQYPLPANVRHLAGVPMWGIEEPGEYSPELPTTKVLSLARRNSESRITAEFVPLLEGLLTEIASPDFDGVHFAHTLHNLHKWFESNDYRSTFRSRAAWETAKSVLLTSAGQEAGLEIGLDGSDPERRPSVEEVKSRFRRLRHSSPATEGGAATTRHLPTLNDATEGMRWLYRLLMPLNFPVVQGDVVHSSGAAFCGIPALLSKLEYGTPMLLTEHGVYMREQYLAISRYGYPFYLKKFVVQMIAAVSRACYAMADQVSPVCHYNARWELRNGVEPEKIKVIYNGVDAAVFTPRPMQKSAAPTVVTVARIDPLKDLETFLRVADATRQRVPGVQFLHFGPVVDVEYDKKVKDLWATLGLQDTVHFHGQTEDPAGALNMGDVTILTSISEAFPYTVVESLACGKPVVATDVGGVREALEGTGMLARPGDVEGLTEGVVRLLSLDAASQQELRDACRARALNLFTIDRSVDAYRAAYLELGSRQRVLPEVIEPMPVPVPLTLATSPTGTDDAVWTDPSDLPERLPESLPDDVPVGGGGVSLPSEVRVPAMAVSAGAMDSARSRLGDPDPTVRAAAAAEVGQLATEMPDAMPLLSAALKDPNPMVRMTALSNIARLLGRQQEAG